MKAAITLPGPTAFDHILSDNILLPQDHPSSLYQSHPDPNQSLANIDSPRLIHRASKSRSRSSLGFRRLLRSHWHSMSSLDGQKSEELKKLGKCVNSNAEAEAVNTALHHCLATRHQAIIDRRMSEYLYAVDEIPAEHEHEHEHSDLSQEGDGYFRDSSDSMTGFEDSTPASTPPRQYAHTTTSHAHSRSNSGSSFRNRASPAAHSFAFAQRRRPSLSTPRSLSFANGPPPNPAVSTIPRPIIVPTDTFNFNFSMLGPHSPPGIYNGPMSLSTTIITANPSGHGRSRSLPHMGVFSGQLRTPQKMKKPLDSSTSNQRSTSAAAADAVASLFSSHAPSPEPPLPTTTPYLSLKISGLRKLTMKTSRVEEREESIVRITGRRRAGTTGSAGLPVKIPESSALHLDSGLVYSPTGPDSVQGINLFASASAAWAGSVTVTTETTTTVSRPKKKKKKKERKIMGKRYRTGSSGGSSEEEEKSMKGVPELAIYP